jgi:hypothetical protein
MNVGKWRIGSAFMQKMQLTDSLAIAGFGVMANRRSGKIELGLLYD